MRIYTKAGDLAFSSFTFPDGQPHFRLETYELEFRTATIELAIKSPADLFLLSLAVDVLRNHGYSEIHLDIRYLLGARMDRSISSLEPHTLQTVARTINSMGFNQVRILDAHSEVATRLIRNSTNLLPVKIVEGIYTTLGQSDVVVVTPDKGAQPRVSELFRNWEYRYCRMEKVRDQDTGRLKGFAFKDGMDNVKERGCLIVDDICDGGGTFVGQAKLLKLAGAKKVFLYVTHGIFSKGLPLEGIDRVFTTDSYWADKDYATASFMGLTVIPVSMKELP